MTALLLFSRVTAKVDTVDPVDPGLVLRSLALRLFSCAEWPGRSSLLGLRILQQNGNTSGVPRTMPGVSAEVGLWLAGAVARLRRGEALPGPPNAQEKALASCGKHRAPTAPGWVLGAQDAPHLR